MSNSQPGHLQNPERSIWVLTFGAGEGGCDQNIWDSLSKMLVGMQNKGTSWVTMTWGGGSFTQLLTTWVIQGQYEQRFQLTPPIQTCKNPPAAFEVSFRFECLRKLRLGQLGLFEFNSFVATKKTKPALCENQQSLESLLSSRFLRQILSITFYYFKHYLTSDGVK